VDVICKRSRPVAAGGIKAIPAVAALLLAIGCGTPRPDPIGPDKPHAGDDACPSLPADHALFEILVDGVDVGLEVRSTRGEDGPLGPERIDMSHEVLRMKMGAVEFERHTVRSERSLAADGTFLRGSHVSKDQVSVRVALVGYNGETWSRLVEKRDSLTDPPQGDPQPLALTGDELIGLKLVDHLRQLALGRADHSIATAYYEPLLDSPVRIAFGSPEPGSTELVGQTIDGVWIEARRLDTGEVVARALFDEKGTLWEERYPPLRQVRRRLPGPLALSAETSALLVGLRSEAYLGLPNSATRAVFRLRTNPDRIEALTDLGTPVNQTLTRDAEGELSLEVSAGAPDGEDAPVEADLGTSRYIKPDAPAIRGALRYLRTAGRQGRLDKPRRDNATAVIAKAGLIRSPGQFWKDPDKVAGLIMRYVSAVLPDKRHTFSMADAVETLDNGAGDCTEHAVLFASLMRAHGIPTRLVAGLYLTRGGLWGYHMWVAYWDGGEWQSIDPGNAIYRPGALYVALGRGASRFADLRENIANFIDRTFSGVAFDLVSASNQGETLSLARPRVPGEHLPETALFNAVVLSGRGDHKGALKLIDAAIPPDRRSIRVKLMRIELMVLDGRHDDALEDIAMLRRQTSAVENTNLLDRLELDALLTTGRPDEAEAILERLAAALDGDEKTLALLRARFHFGTGDETGALETLIQAIATVGQEPELLAAHANYVARRSEPPSEPSLEQALQNAQLALVETMAADHVSLAATARVLHRSGRHLDAVRMLEHALILAPSDRDLLELREATIADRCLER
jgi:tetratricopeptide (TPR) repeat protein